MLDEIDELLADNRAVMRPHRLERVFPGWRDCMDTNVNHPWAFSLGWELPEQIWFDRLFDETAGPVVNKSILSG